MKEILFSLKQMRDCYKILSKSSKKTPLILRAEPKTTSILSTLSVFSSIVISAQRHIGLYFVITICHRDDRTSHIVTLNTYYPKRVFFPITIIHYISKDMKSFSLDQLIKLILRVFYSVETASTRRRINLVRPNNVR